MPYMAAEPTLVKVGSARTAATAACTKVKNKQIILETKTQPAGTRGDSSYKQHDAQAEEHEAI